ncbi:hypothetical protein [Streptomyces katrae]|uniref:hypothetical protein n=1 Tax=Streptomyces katrae TaxID=68223 RepID=UPI0012FEF9EE|nr:hypothetical protein [Streptomyces katrae]
MRENPGLKRGPYGIPKDIVLLATPSGWRHSTTTVDGTLICGRLTRVPITATAEQAKEAAAALLVELGREFHRTALEVTWEPDQVPGSCSGRIHPSPESGASR